MALNNTNFSEINVTHSLNQWLPFEVSFASLALVPNLLISVVLFHDRRLLRQSALIFGFISSNMVIILACACAIAYQLYLYAGNQSSSQESIIVSCLCTFAPQLLWFSFATKALFLLAFGVDRLLAVAVGMWYHKKWTTRTSWCVTGSIYLSSLISVGATWIDAELHSGRSSNSCGNIAFTSNAAFMYGLFLKILGGTVCASTTLVSLFVGRHRQKKMNSSTEAGKRMKKQMALIKTMLILASFDVVLVVIPNTLLFLDFILHIGLPSFVNLAGPLACCIDTAVSAFTLLLFNSKIRHSTVKFLKLDQLSIMSRVEVFMCTRISRGGLNRVSDITTHQ